MGDFHQFSKGFRLKMVKITLTYFNGRGFAEPSRWVLKHVGAEFEDVRHTKETWPEVKPKSLTGKRPQLEYGDFTMSESTAIVRFLGKEFGLAGKTNQDQAKADMAVDVMKDLLMEFAKCKYEEDEERKKKMLEKLTTVSMPAFFKTLSKLLELNGGKHFASDTFTYADIFVACFMDSLILYGKQMNCNVREFWDDKLEALKTSVMELPNIKAHVAARPETEF